MLVMLLRYLGTFNSVTVKGFCTTLYKNRCRDDVLLGR